jgi:hypothetical protein
MNNAKQNALNSNASAPKHFEISMIENADQSKQTPKSVATGFLALLFLLSITAISFHDIIVSTPRAIGIWNPRAEPTFLQVIAPSDQRVIVQEDCMDVTHVNRVESYLNIDRSGGWAAAIFLTTSIMMGLIKTLSIFEFRNML